jgi:hypothetical protein
VILDGTYEQDCDYLYDKSVLESNSNPKLRSQVSSSTGSNFTLNVQVPFQYHVYRLDLIMHFFFCAVQREALLK